MTPIASNARWTVPDDGFVEVVSPELARRQFNMSLGLLGAIAVAVVAVGVSVGLPAACGSEPRVATLTVQQPQFVRPMSAEIKSVRPSGV